jgi:hypothetical protein
MRKCIRNGLIAAVLGIALSYAGCSDDFGYGSSSDQYAGIGSASVNLGDNPYVGDSVQQYAGLVISKLYFTGSGSAVRDQYFRITNNSNSTIDAEGVVLLESKFNSSTAYYGFIPSIDSTFFVVDIVYQIPSQTLIEPDNSIILAYQQAEVPEGLDLSGADYAWETGDPLLRKIFSYSATIWLPHNRGFCSYAIGKLPADSATFIDDYKYTGSYYLDVTNSAGITTTYSYTATKAYKFPNEWIIDGVNVVSPDPAEQNVQTIPYVLDAGKTSTGVIPSNSTSRFGVAISRNSVNGKYIDTNNSTNDFAVSADPDPSEP